MAERYESTTRTTKVVHVASPKGKARENGPHLQDLREFVEACKGLPEDLKVDIHKGHMGESGRYDVRISVNYIHPEDVDGVDDVEDFD